MSKIILFSPVGGTDPIDQTNCYDGSMLHICRKRKVDEVYLFLSAEMLEKQEQDQRFTKAIEKLAHQQQRNIDIHLIENPELLDPHKFDQFYDVFSKHVEKISETMEDGDKLLFNISSGTPAMKSAPLVLNSLNEISCECVQVSTPTKRMGDHVHEQNYDLDSLWELDPDNSDNSLDRTETVSCPSLSLIRDKQRIIELIREHEYYFAYLLAQDMPKNKTSSFIKYLEFAKERASFNLRRARVLEKELGIDCMPVRSEEFGKIFEYALICDLKLKRHELSDFLRSLTPLLQELFFKIIEKQLGISMDPKKEKSYVMIAGNQTKWDLDKIFNCSKYIKEVEEQLYKPLKNLFDRKDKDKNTIYNSQLAKIIKVYCDKELIHSSLSELANDLREKVENKLRNPVAHQVIQITEDQIQKYTGGIGSNDIMNMLKKLFDYTAIGFNAKNADEYWQSYEKMNELIIAKINGDDNASTN